MMIRTKEVTAAADSGAVALTTESDTDRNAGRSVAVRNKSGGVVWLGGQDVSPENGWDLPDGEDISLDLFAGDRLFAVGDPGVAVSLRVFQVGV